MKKSRSSLMFLLVWLIFVSHQIVSVVCETGQYIDDEEEKTSFFHVVSSTISSLKKSHLTSWEKIKTVLHGLQLKFTPPNLEAPGTGTTGVSESAGEDTKKGIKQTGTIGGSESAGENIKEAAKKSVEAGTETVEKTAKSAADAVHHTAEKLKETVSDNKGSRDDL
ncbi:hypothetical protein V6Z11_D11G249600 [Gossypium hirsutum]|uniref:Uncharacterized protein isoform X2 n=1 Tax=Gossypium hirsutum TaxID=3635 RepID=A0A1U8NNH4_GOSHI|nr:uncharacterized protein LOC107949282 isoform X2 [Gossypium hirsutum]